MRRLLDIHSSRRVLLSHRCFAWSTAFFVLLICLLANSQELHWSLQPPQRITLSQLARNSWVQTPVDAFILQKLASHSLTPARREAKRRLFRRVTLDLTGLPPTRQEMGQFLDDSSPNAYERLVDRLLTNPAYGERWAQHWLDVVRYADSDGFEYDETRPAAWR